MTAEEGLAVQSSVTEKSNDQALDIDLLSYRRSRARSCYGSALPFHYDLQLILQ